jgi:hypothetical protein
MQTPDFFVWLFLPTSLGCLLRLLLLFLFLLINPPFLNLFCNSGYPRQERGAGIPVQLLSVKPFALALNVYSRLIIQGEHSLI